MHSRKSFTLVEMLIVIVIIGILAAALIPRITGTQARARDVARESDTRDLTNAITMYSVDHDGRYPPAFDDYTSLPSSLQTASTGPLVYTPNRLLASIPQGATEGTVEVLGNNLSTYISALPEDPSGKGIGAVSPGNTDCEIKGPSYAYYSPADGDRYAITAKMEKARGNTNNCGGEVDTSNGAYKTAGVGLAYSVSDAPYPDESQWTDASCFDFNDGTILKYVDSCSKSVVIPAEIDGEKVIAIGEGSFDRNHLPAKDHIISLAIPGSILSIGEKAFNFNRLESLILPDKLETISAGAFMRPQNLAWKEGMIIKIPESVEILGDDSFARYEGDTAMGLITDFDTNKEQSWKFDNGDWVKQ